MPRSPSPADDAPFGSPSSLDEEDLFGSDEEIPDGQEIPELEGLGGGGAAEEGTALSPQGGPELAEGAEESDGGGGASSLHEAFAAQLQAQSRSAAEERRAAWARHEEAVLRHLEAFFRGACEQRARLGAHAAHADFSLPLERLFPNASVEGTTHFGCLAEGKELPEGTWWLVNKGPGFQELPGKRPDRADVITFFERRLRSRIAKMGFRSVEWAAVPRTRYQTMKVSVSWEPPSPGGEPVEKKRRVQGSLRLECGICAETRELALAAPCGHLACHACLERSHARGHCAFCKQRMDYIQNVFKP